MSILDYPELLSEVVPHIKLEHYNKDKDHTESVRSRIELRGLSSDLLRRLLDFSMPCVACGHLMQPFRRRKGSEGSNGVYYAASCPLDVNKSCSRTRAASAEYQRVFIHAWENRPSENDRDLVAEILEVERVFQTPPFRADAPKANEIVYFIGAWFKSELIGIKIGKSTRPIEHRLKGLQTGSPYQLRVIGLTNRFFEKALHRRFEGEGLALHLEWFQPKQALLDFIRQECPEGEYEGFPKVLSEDQRKAVQAQAIEALQNGKVGKAKDFLRTLHDY